MMSYSYHDKKRIIVDREIRHDLRHTNVQIDLDSEVNSGKLVEKVSQEDRIQFDDLFSHLPLNPNVELSILTSFGLDGDLAMQLQSLAAMQHTKDEITVLFHKGILPQGFLSCLAWPILEEKIDIDCRIAEYEKRIRDIEAYLQGDNSIISKGESCTIEQWVQTIEAIQNEIKKIERFRYTNLPKLLNVINTCKTIERELAMDMESMILGSKEIPPLMEGSRVNMGLLFNAIRLTSNSIEKMKHLSSKDLLLSSCTDIVNYYQIHSLEEKTQISDCCYLMQNGKIPYSRKHEEDCPICYCQSIVELDYLFEEHNLNTPQDFLVQNQITKGKEFISLNRSMIYKFSQNTQITEEIIKLVLYFRSIHLESLLQ